MAICLADRRAWSVSGNLGEKSGSDVTCDITVTLPVFSAGRNPTSETKDTEWCLARI